LTEVYDSGLAPNVTDGMRELAVKDLRFWNADALVLLISQKNFDALWQTVSALVSRDGEERDGVWVWDVRDLTR
jgi:hypothetical protein